MKTFTLNAFAVAMVIGYTSLSSHVYANNIAANNEAADFIAQPNKAAPVITDSQLGEAVENQPWEKQLSAKDKDGLKQVLYFQLVSGPPGFTVSATGLAQWNPGFNDHGDHIIKISVSDGQRRSIKALALTVEDVNRAPEWQQSSLAPAKEGVSYNIKLQAQDADNQALTFSLKSALKGMAIEGGYLTWRPNFEQAGVHRVIIVASDGIDKTTQTFQLSVDNTNRAPQITSRSSFELSENEPFKVQLKAKDADKLVQFSYKKLAGPETLTVSSEGQLSFTPNFDDAGLHSVLVEVSDGEAAAVQRMRIQVEDTNRAPEWQTKSLPTGQELQHYAWQLEAVDADKADTLTYTLKSGPKGLTISPAGMITFQPSYEQAGVQNITVVISDGKADVKRTFKLDIGNTNRAPQFTSTAVTVADENSTYKYKLKALDADNDKIAYELVTGPEGLRLEGSTLKMLPTYEQAGEYPVHVKVADNSTDGSLTDEQFFMIQVANANRAAKIEALQDGQYQAAENAPWQVQINASDVDGDTLFYSLLTYPVGMTINNGQLNWTPSFEDEGEHAVSVLVNDGSVGTRYDFSITVANTNRVPSFTSAPILTAKENQAYQYVLGATDPDRTALKFQLVSGPKGLMLDPSHNNTLLWQPGFQQSGEHKVVVAVLDGESTIEQSYTVNVENTNRPPVFPTAVTKVVEDNNYEYQANAQDPDLEDNRSVVVTATTLPEGIRFKNNTLSWKPDFKAAGAYPVVLSATDGDLVTKQSFTLVVENNNRAPVVSSSPKAKAHETLSYQYTIKASDADNEAMTYTLISGPEGMKLSGTTIDWTPLYTQGGAQTVVIGVSDGIDTTEQSFNVTVENANRTPSLETIPPQTVVLGSKFNYQLIGSDVDGDNITFKLVHGPKGMSLNAKGVLQYKPKAVSVEPEMVVVQVDDGELKKRRRFELEVVDTAE